MRILHLADVHLDTSFSGRSPEIRARLRRAVREAFRQAMDVALEREVHAVVIAGDLFDSHSLSFESERFLVEELARVTTVGIPVVYATGNHDPGSHLRSRRQIPWPDGVTVVAGPEPVRVEIRDRNGEAVGRITAVGHATAREDRDLSARFPAPKGELPEVAVLHTQVLHSRGSESHDRYAPSELSTLQQAGYDYWALGHVHLRQELADLPGIHYPGNLQGRTPRETGSKGVLVAEVARGLPPTATFVPLAPVRWEELVIGDAGAAGTTAALIQLIRDRWEAARQEDGEPDAEWMVRVRLEGPSPLWRELAQEEDRDHLARELEGALGALEVQIRAGRVHAPVRVEEHLEREDVLGMALRLVREVRAGRNSLPGLEEELAGAPGGDGLQAYVAELLEDSEGELVSRLRKEEE